MTDIPYDAWRMVFCKIIELRNAFDDLQKLTKREVTTEDEIGYTCGDFLRQEIAHNNPAKCEEILAGLKRGLQL